MHWLSQQVKEIGSLAEQHRRLQGAEGNSASALRAREELMGAFGRLVEQVAARPGVLASFASHEGLLIAKSGHAADFDALAALGDQCVRTCAETAHTLSLGGARQVLIVGADRKLALLSVGQMVLGILSEEATRLAETLER